MDYISNAVYLLITITLILSLIVGMIFTVRSFEQQRKLQDTINRRQKEKETETLKQIAGEYLHQRVINGLILPHLINLKEASHFVGTAKSASKKEITARLNGLIDGIMEMESVVRNISENIFPSHLSEYFIPVCQKHLQELEKRLGNGEKIVFESDNMLTDLKCFPTLLYNLYSLIDLFVTNSLKHAQATDIKVSIQRKKDTLSLTMSDNGVGFDIRGATLFTKGRGLADFKSRAIMLAPTFLFDSEKGKGTRFNLLINLKAWK